MIAEGHSVSSSVSEHRVTAVFYLQVRNVKLVVVRQVVGP